MSKREGIMLCQPFEEARLLGKIKRSIPYAKPYLVQPKLDGERCRVLLSRGEPVKLLSSTGNLIVSVPHINRSLEEWYRVIGSGCHQVPIELDGELYCHGMHFEDIHSIVSREYVETLHPDREKISLHLFDLIDGRKQLERLENLEFVRRGVERYAIPFINVVNTYNANNLQKVLDLYEEIIKQGYEGIVVRCPNNLYERKRSLRVMKFKPKQTDTYVINDVYEAVSEQGVPKGIIGGFIVSSGEELFRVGAGELTHTERYRMWILRDQLPGRMLEVRYQTVTKKGLPKFALATRVMED